MGIEPLQMIKKNQLANVMATTDFANCSAKGMLIWSMKSHLQFHHCDTMVVDCGNSVANQSSLIFVPAVLFL